MVTNKGGLAPSQGTMAEQIHPSNARDLGLPEEGSVDGTLVVAEKMH